jgi:hypothetical protein
MIIKYRVEIEDLMDEKILDFLVYKIERELSKLGLVYIQQGNYFCEGFIDFIETKESKKELVNKICETIELIDSKLIIKNCG